MHPAIQNCLRAVGWGGLVGGGPFMIFTVPIGVMTLADANDLLGGMFGGLWLAISPVLIAGAVALGAMAVLGLPLTALLKNFRRESGRAYAVAGGALGLLIPSGIGIALDGGEAGLWFGLLLGLPGLLAGVTTGSVWGGWRESVAVSYTAADGFI